EGESCVRQTGRYEGELVGDGTHGADLEGRVLEWLPVAAFQFAAAGEHDSAIQAGSLAGLDRLAVVGDPSLQRTNESLVRYRVADSARNRARSEEHTSELQSRGHLVCRLLLEKKKRK